MMFFRKKRSNKKLINFPVLHVKPKASWLELNLPDSSIVIPQLQQTSANKDDFMEQEERIVTQISSSVSTNYDTDSQEKDEV